MGNLCCQEPTNIGQIAMQLQDNIFENSQRVEITHHAKETYQHLIPLNFDKTKYQDLQQKPPQREINKQFVYTGTWKNNIPQGFGNIVFNNGDYYEGQFKNGKAEGKGRYILNNGDYFEGDVYNNKALGIGKYIGSNIQYDGQWSNSQPTIGTFRVKKSQTYIKIDNVQTDIPSGQIEWVNNDRYVGQILNYYPEGLGKICFSDGRLYNGEWSKGAFSGYGVFTWPDGKQYKGQYLNGLRHGRGQFIFSDSRRYQGEWRNGKQNGKVHEGVFKQGVPLNIKEQQNSSLIRNSVIAPQHLSFEAQHQTH